MNLKGKDLKMKVVKLVDVAMNPNNARSIGKEALDGLKASLDRFGYVEPIVWNKKTGHIIGGHQRYALLVESGVTEAMMVVADLSPEDELAATITLNNPEIEGQWNDEAPDLLHQLELSDGELFGKLRMDTLLTSLEKAVKPESNYDTECPCCSHRWKIEAKDIRASA